MVTRAALVAVGMGALAASCGGTVHDERGGTNPGDPTGNAGGSAVDGGATSTGGAVGAGGATTIVDSGPPSFDCPSDFPPPLETNAGECAPPAPPAFQGSSCACWDVPGGPGADQCAASHATEIGGKPCCLGGTCSFDFGRGCEPVPVDSPTGSTKLDSCANHSKTTPALIRTGSVQAMTVTAQNVWTVDVDDIGVSTLARVDKSTCVLAAAVTLPGYVSSLAATSWGVLYVSGGALLMTDDAGREYRYPSLSQATAAEVVALAGTPQVFYAIVNRPSEAGVPTSTLISIAGYGDDPAVLATFDAWQQATRNRLLVDGSFAYVLSDQRVLDVAPMSTLRRIDVGSGAVDVVLDQVKSLYTAFAVNDGSVYLGSGRDVSSVRLPGCFTSTVVPYRPGTITALVLHADVFVWAETSPGLSFSTVYSRARGGGDAKLLGDVAGTVQDIEVDDTDAYVLAQPGNGVGASVVRVPL
ncbi:MAG TPA: hypothetical protein VHE30_17715 [Polyangiaceae bacterium]|nr:hypothetical protein [Polyangiaceae bacterium]